MAGKKDSSEREGSQDELGQAQGEMDKKQDRAGAGPWKRVRHIMGVALRSFCLLLLALAIVAGVWFYVRYGADILQMKRDAEQAVASSTRDTFRQAETSLVYDTDGNLLSTLKGEKDVYYIGIAEIPTEAIEAMISIEDKKFYKHRGVDPKAILRAAWALVENDFEITQGASTITQQLSRNIFLTHEESWERKVREIFTALAMEKKYSKADIMEFYLNNIYFSNGYYGIQAASYGYFDRSVKELSLSELTFLCAIPNNPTLYDPFINMDNTLARRNRILDQMVEDGKLDAASCAQAKGEEIALAKKERKRNSDAETYAYDCAVRALMARGGFQFRYTFGGEEDKERYMEEYGRLYSEYQSSLYTGGYRIYTSLDMEKQALLFEALDRALLADTEVNEEGVYALQGAAVLIDNDNGRVAAIVGSRSQEFAGYTLNRAYQSFRQPGSAIKPLIVYTPAFERGLYPEDMVVDEKSEDGPRNVDEVYSGEISVLRAVASSKNTVAWNLFEELTPARGLSYLLEMNFSHITRDDYYPAASLGGLSQGVSTLEMTSAFAALEQEGIYRQPTCIVKIMDAQGNELVSGGGTEKRIYGQEASRRMLACLQEVMKSGTGRNGALPGMPCAGKTGTTNAQKDKWFVGFTGYYTAGVWVGYDLPRPLQRLPYGTEPLMIWKDFMGKLHEGKEAREFADYIHLPKEEEEPEEEDTGEEGEDTGEEEPEEIPDWEPPEEIPEDGWDDEDWEDGWDDGDWDGDDWEDEDGDGSSGSGGADGSGGSSGSGGADGSGGSSGSGGSGGADGSGSLPDPPSGEPEGGTEPEETPSFDKEDLSPEDYRFFYGEDP